MAYGVGKTVMPWPPFKNTVGEAKCFMVWMWLMLYKHQDFWRWCFIRLCLREKKLKGEPRFNYNLCIAS
jgi:hypothetical protein